MIWAAHFAAMRFEKRDVFQTEFIINGYERSGGNPSADIHHEYIVLLRIASPVDYFVVGLC